MIEALTRGRIAGAGLDVYNHEPAIDPRFLAIPNVILLPHLGSATYEGREASGERVIANIRIFPTAIVRPIRCSKAGRNILSKSGADA